MTEGGICLTGSRTEQRTEFANLWLCVCVSVLWGYKKVFLQVGAEWITTLKKNEVYNVFGEQQLYAAKGRSLGRSTKKKGTQQNKDSEYYGLRSLATEDH